MGMNTPPGGDPVSTRKTQTAERTTAPSSERRSLPLTASLVVDPERLARMWAMSRAERVAAAQQGQLSLGEMLRWAARAPQEVPTVNGPRLNGPGEFFFITAYSADAEA
jgi:hypothetical protein